RRAPRCSSPRSPILAASSSSSDSLRFFSFDGCKGFARRLERALELRRAMRAGDKSRLVGRPCEIDHALEHGVKELVEALSVRFHHFGEARRRRRAEIDAEHAAD